MEEDKTMPEETEQSTEQVHRGLPTDELQAEGGSETQNADIEAASSGFEQAEKEMVESTEPADEPVEPVSEPETVEISEDQPRKYPEQWFTLHVLSGQEFNVKRYMENRRKTEEMGDFIHEIIVPTERVSEVKRGKKVETERKLYPGYVFANMYLVDEEKKVVEKTWYFVKDTPGVLGFASGERPIPMRKDEVDGLLTQIREGEDKVMPKVSFELGDRVKVGDGPFQSQEGVIEEIDPDRGRLRVSVSIFGRSTPVELEYWQVEKM